MRAALLGTPPGRPAEGAKPALAPANICTVKHVHPQSIAPSNICTLKYSAFIESCWVRYSNSHAPLSSSVDSRGRMRAPDYCNPRLEVKVFGAQINPLLGRCSPGKLCPGQ